MNPTQKQFSLNREASRKQIPISKTILALIALTVLALTGVSRAIAQTTAFTYQGRLNDNGAPANGNYDLQFSLRDAVANGNQIGSSVTNAPVAVSNGLFTVTLNFGGANVFPGADRWLEIGVRTNGNVSAYTTLAPRQALTPTPYSLFAANAGVATLASTVANGAVGVNQLASNAVSELALNSNLVAKVNAWYTWQAASKPIFTSPTATNGFSGVPFSFNATATNFPGGNFWGFNYTVTGLPNGLVQAVDFLGAFFPCNDCPGIAGTPTVIGTFPITFTAQNIAGVTTHLLNLTITAVAPTITMQPTNQTVFLGSTATFSVSAVGTAPLFYQWQKDGNPIAGATNATYNLTNVLSSQAGIYRVNVSNYVNSVSSSNAVLTLSYVLAWGDNYYMQTTVPAGLSNVVAIAAGVRHGLALQTNGTVAAWGDNYWGQTDVPAGFSNVVAVAAGGDHSLALRADGIVVAWGDNYYMQTTVPAGLSNVVAVAGGYYYSLVLQTNGTVAAWGDNYWGQTDVPVDLSNVVAIAAGVRHGLALQTNGTVAAWGDNTLGQTDVPVGLSNVVAVAAGYYHSLVLQTNGTVVAWGYNTWGQTNVPAGLSNVVAVAAGGNHSLALRADGTLVTWGSNEYGQTTIPNGLGTNTTAIACGGQHTLIAVDDGGKPKLTGKVGVAFSYQIQPAGKPKYYAIGLPTGLTLNATTGLITGTPSATSTRSVLLGTRTTALNASQVFSLTIAP